MRSAPSTVERAHQGSWCDLAAFAAKRNELDTAAEEFRRAAFVRCDMRILVTEDRAPGRSEMRERERIGCCPGCHEKHRDLALEKLAQALLDARGPGVATIGEHLAFIRAGDRRNDFRRDAGCIVAREIHAVIP